MAERGEPKNLIVEDKKTDEKMTERGEPNVDDVEDKRAADIKAFKAIKRIMRQMIPLYGPAQHCNEAAFMYDLLAEQMEKIEIMTLTDEEIVQLLKEEDED